MGIAEVLLAIFVVLKLLGYPAAAAIGWSTLFVWYAGFYGVLLALTIMFVGIAYWSNR